MCSSRGRVVKALDLKSNGVSPRRFDWCSLEGAVSQRFCAPGFLTFFCVLWTVFGYFECKKLFINIKCEDLWLQFYIAPRKCSEKR